MKSTQKQTISTGFQPEAMVNAAWVAEVYQNGWGVAQDYSKAHKWFKKAADDGNTAAMINLGRLYEQGLGVAQDFEKALEWFQKAVGAGNRDATVNLGWLYEQGLVSNDLTLYIDSNYEHERIPPPRSIALVSTGLPRI